MDRTKDVTTQTNDYIEHKVKVTIGLCVRNEEENIQDTIRSIVEQDFPHQLMELIVLDDGSLDSTLSIVLRSVQQFDMHVRLFHTEWKGIGSARNMVVGNARGDYIVWVDGGMMLPADHVRRHIQFMEGNPKVAIAKAKCGTVEDGNIISTLESLQYLAVDSRYDGIVESFVVGTGGSIYRVRAIREIGGFDNLVKRSGEDLDAEYRLRDGGWLVCRTPVVFYRKHCRTWKSAWYDGVKYGYGGHYLIDKYKRTLLRRSVISGLDGFFNARTAYKLTRRKLAFLLPFHRALKTVAWFFGYLKAYFS